MMRILGFLVRLLGYCPGGIWNLVLASFFLNLLFLVSPLYMMHIYDSVIGANSQVNLFAISAIAAFLYFALFGFDALRTRILAAAAPEIERSFDRYARAAVQRDGIGGETFVSVAQALDRLQRFVLSPGIFSFLDLPFSPLFLLVAFLIHPLVGLVGAIGAAILVALAFYFGHRTDGWLAGLQGEGRTQGLFGAAVLAQQEFVQTSHARDFILSRWMRQRGKAQYLQLRGAQTMLLGLSVTKTLRLVFQSSILGFGAWLVLHQSLSAGAIIAASVVVSRAMMPMEQTAVARRTLQLAMAAMDSLSEADRAVPPPTDKRDKLTAGAGGDTSILVRNLTYQYEGALRPILNDLNLTIPSGAVCAISGPIGSGKSTLLRCMLGLLTPKKGHISLGGVIVSPATVERFADSLAYLPQQNQLFPISIEQNIALSAGADIEQRARDAARIIGCDAAINSLKDGYATIPFNERGCTLSPGLVQGIALARTIANVSPILLLDEPTQSLDGATIERFRRAMADLKSAGTTIVVVTHDPVVVGSSDVLLLFHPIAGPLFGPTREILSRLNAIEGRTGAARPGGLS